MLICDKTDVRIGSDLCAYCMMHIYKDCKMCPSEINIIRECKSKVQNSVLDADTAKKILDILEG